MDPLVDALRAAGLDPGSWANGPGDVYAPHAHAYDKVLVVAQGSIVFGLPDLGRSEALTVGDRLDLPAGTRHEARVGDGGVTCLEAHLRAGTLGPAPARLRAGEWGVPGEAPPFDESPGPGGSRLPETGGA